jgi:FG-GAP-like repeat
MLLSSWLRNGKRLALATHRPRLEVLEDRTLPSFADPVSYAAGSQPFAVVTADFNGDARAVGDVNGDGALDLVVANDVTNFGQVSVLLGNGDGTFQSPRTVSAGGSNVVDLAVADFNADGKMDLAVAGQNSGYFGGRTDVTVLLGHGDGTFDVSYDRVCSVYDEAPGSIAARDFNGDGKLDLVWTDQTLDAVGVQLGNGDGTFHGPGFFFTDQFPDSVAVADLNGDARLDLVTANYYGSVSVLLGNGDGSFQAAKNYSSVNHPLGVAATDFNGDGKPDLAAAGFYSPGSGAISVLLGNGDGTFRSAQYFAAGSDPESVAVGDFNSDGRPDVAVPDYSNGNVLVLLNTGDWRSLQVSGFPSPTTAGQAQTFTLSALDNYGNPLPNYSGTVHFTSSDLQAVLPADYTFTAADHGTHTFSATLKTMGYQSLTVTERGTSIPGTQAVINVKPAAASRFTFGGFPWPVAGAACGFTVAAWDPYGNRAIGYTGTVHFTSSDPQAVLPADYTFTADEGGMHAFSPTLKTAGTQSLAATDTANPAITGSQAGIRVNPAAASRLVLSAPSSVKANTAFSLTVTVVDAYGNVVTGYRGTLALSSSDATADLPKHYTFKAADQGVHTFTGLKLKKKGRQTITLTDTLNSSLSAGASIDVL